ncbi:MAG: hypothetical protein Q4B21_07055, partial [Bacteroidia bacterium]|nr:hypothetical protein [Bacteroidia bacterium]
KITKIQASIGSLARGVILQKRVALEVIEKRIENADPTKKLGKGYAIVAVEGNMATVEQIKEGTRVKLIMSGGEVEFEVGKVLKTKLSGR